MSAAHTARALTRHFVVWPRNFSSSAVIMKYKFSGLMAPTLTPFTNDSEQKLSLGCIPQYAQFLSSKGIHGVLVNGTSGEGMSMTVEEREAATEAWAKAVKVTKQNLMVQVGGACLPDVLRMARHAEALGADGLLCLPELFNSPAGEQQLVDYLALVAAAAPRTPLLYYHNPPYSGVHVDMPKVLALAEKQIPTFAGAKYTDTDMQTGAHCLRIPNTSVFLGCDNVLAGAFALGFDSAIATTLNMVPGHGTAISAAVARSDVARARQEQAKLTDAIFAISRNGGWVSTMKVAMNLLTDIDVGGPRPPLRPLNQDQVQQMKVELKGLGLL